MNDTKFCTSCQTTQPLATGEFKQTKSIRRWICKGCLDHKYESIYKNRNPRPAHAPRGTL